MLKRQHREIVEAIREGRLEAVLKAASAETAASDFL
jgi:DNA-binding FadR family transcriptional regulator